MTNGEDEETEDRSLPPLLPPEADEVTAATTPIERRATPRTAAQAFDRSKGAAFLVGSGILLSRLAGLIRQTMMARYGPPLRDEMLGEAREHASRLVGAESKSRAREAAVPARGGS